MFQTFRPISFALAALLIAGCGTFGNEEKYEPDYDNPAGKPKDVEIDSVSRSGLGDKTKGELYQVKPSRSLELPPDLVTSTNETVLENAAVDEDQELRILPDIVGAEIVNDEGAYSLVVDTSVENTWKVMTEYWALGNIDLVTYSPEAGQMETEWIEEARIYEDDNIVVAVTKEIFTSLTKTDTVLDKFRLRFERLDVEKSAIHVSHRWIARKELHYARRDSEFAWVELEQDDGRIADFMNNIILLFDDTASST